MNHAQILQNKNHLIKVYVVVVAFFSFFFRLLVWESSSWLLVKTKADVMCVFMEKQLLIWAMSHLSNIQWWYPTINPSRWKNCCRKTTRMFMLNCKHVIDSPSNIYHILLWACEAGCVWNRWIVHLKCTGPEIFLLIDMCAFGVTGTGMEIILLCWSEDKERRCRFKGFSPSVYVNLCHSCAKPTEQNSFIILYTALLYTLCVALFTSTQTQVGS